MKKVLHNFRSLLYCICEFSVGILILIDPISFTSAIIRILGIVLAVLGVFNIKAYFKLEPLIGSMSMSFSKGLVQIVAGLFCVFDPEWFSRVFPLLAIVYGIVVLVIGLIKLQWAVDVLRLGHGVWLIPGIGGISSVVLGAVIVLNPFASVEILWVFIGVTLIAEAIIDGVSTFFESKTVPVKTDTGYEVEITDGE